MVQEKSAVCCRKKVQHVAGQCHSAHSINFELSNQTFLKEVLAFFILQ